MGEFIGHSRILNNLNSRISTGEISHAHIIVGEDGIGKSPLANIMAKNILGIRADRECVDIINYRLKKASFGVDEAREIISEINKKPYEGDKKIIIIHDGNKLTVQAQNALLKTIEEPPKGVYIILLCESLELILDTIKSRCEIHKLTPLSNEEVSLYLKKIGISEYKDEEISAAISYAEGIPGKAEAFLKDSSLKNLRDILIDLLYKIIKGDISNLLEYEDKLSSYKEKKEEILNILSSFIRDIMVFKEINNEKGIINKDKINDIKQLAIEMSYKKLTKIIDKIGECRHNLLKNSNFLLTVRVMLIGFMEVK
ncbi:DNA polymerase III subunit delta' [Caproiciproducens sp. MSJ-32]|uniref:DNA polymerase III subunit delta' n=1 Tax=Caproiciproducens sp. MSJ-32 TaxID=2841527 RepID=UPI001C11BC53|nr:DNA polymerase III subunit delta' [Caproiciproducens sp. MSJ-32]MBU5455673.1 DNA polymerase III subunit delta' [Caproiciproducens sp. MSJ-32]